MVVLVAWGIAVHHESLASAWFLALCIAALIGLLRRVSWGRFLVSIISVLCALSVFANIIPDPNDTNAGALQRLLGFPPPIWFTWLFVVVSATLILLPAVVIGWRKAWFRAVWW